MPTDPKKKKTKDKPKGFKLSDKQLDKVAGGQKDPTSPTEPIFPPRKVPKPSEGSAE